MERLMTKTRMLIFRWWFKIKEPRFLRLIYLAFYATILGAGFNAFVDSPTRFYAIGGELLVLVLGISFIIGGIFGIIAIIPGTWWLERTGLISIAFGLALRGILIAALGVSSTGALIFAGEVLLLLARFITIRKADLAPAIP